MARAREAGGSHADLTAAEIELLLRICKRYLVSLPRYLQSVQAESRAIETLLEKLLRAAPEAPADGPADD
jgi:hypothetical protein